ncbi:SH22A protein, partial [Anhinga anhinga]|nr:SH22A protein [Anhinga anhinga]
TGDPVDEDHPLFSTFKPISEDARQAGPEATPVQPRGAEQPPGHHGTDGRVGHGAAEGPSPPSRRSWPSLSGWSLSEEDPRPELVALRTRTRLWFEQTQARRLVAKGELPTWFYGFISRRETEQLLQDQPLGCFLVRFSESTVGFVLSYRGMDRCRHFILDQLPDGRYVILGEQSAHAELADLLRHYTTAPITPYLEFLTVPCGRADEPQGGPWAPASSNAARTPSSEALANLPAYSAVSKGSPGARQAAATLPLPAEPSPYSQAHKEAVPPVLPTPADAKYQQLMCFHTYSEPHEGRAPSPSAAYELEEPIPFYAMGRGSSPGAGPKENIYSEV